MGSGAYIFCEWNAVQKSWGKFQDTMIRLEQEIIQKCNAEWKPKTFGYLTPNAGQYGRTTILPALFNNNSGVQMAHWRQAFTSTGHQTLMTGTRAGNTIPEDFKVAITGFAFPNKNQHITEIKWQKGDKKYGRIDLEEMLSYNVPAVILEEGFMIDEEESFELYGYVEGPLPENGPGGSDSTIYQRIVPLGACYYKQIDRVLGNTGAAI